ncbi:hypothetical protein COBT_000313, partial [Conglomerata obtusa]
MRLFLTLKSEYINPSHILYKNKHLCKLQIKDKILYFVLKRRIYIVKDGFEIIYNKSTNNIKNHSQIKSGNKKKQYAHKNNELQNTDIIKLTPKTNYSFSEYKNYQTLLYTPLEYSTLLQKNDFQYVPPSFVGLFLQHAIAPLFVFQIFSSLLWCLDEYPYHAAFTVVMQIIFEAGVVFSRLKNLKEFGTLNLKTSEVELLHRKINKKDNDTGNAKSNNSNNQENKLVRNEKGIKKNNEKTNENIISTKEYSNKDKINYVNDFLNDNNFVSKYINTKELQPGDVIFLKSPGIQIPCDLLILEGVCAVNEAMLTGESIPLTKEDIKEKENAILDLEGHKKHILYGGTDLIKINETLKCFVLKTGFETNQGKLIKKMMFSEESNFNNEAFYFIGCLLVFAIFASIYVIKSGIENGKTSYKIMIEVIMILTNVVPPELPMEMTIAISSALQSLLALNIFCLEGSRIPVCGKVDVCCFDKTGTLTEIEMDVNRIVLLEHGEVLEVTRNENRLSIKKIETINGTNNQLNNKDTSNCSDDNIKDISNKVKRQEVNQDILNSSLSNDELKRNVGDKKTTHNFNTNNIKNNKITNNKHKNENKSKIALKNKSITNEECMSNSLENLTASVATCHSLIKMNTYIGDPMETSTFKFLDLNLINENRATDENNLYSVIKRYSFCSELRRMTVVAELTDINSNHNKSTVFVSCKGAPEVIENLLENVPNEYKRYKEYAQQGYRVIALAYKNYKRRVDYNREDVEKNLIFIGFVLYECKIKKGTEESIKLLKESGHEVVMITGDNLMTAVNVAMKVGIIEDDNKKNNKMNDIKKNDDKMDDIKKGDDKKNIKKDINKDDNKKNNFKKNHPNFKNIQDSKNNAGNNSSINVSLNDSQYYNQIGVEGDEIDKVLESKDFYMYKIFARADPKHKERIIKKYKDNNKVTLMCGDGTNDVGALKISDVGVALVEVKKKIKKDFNKNLESRNSNNNRSFVNPEELKVKMGDASVAAPFTAKTGSISAVLDIIRQGRSTLVTTIQMYKILALNSLISAYSLSVLDCIGVRYGDVQMTISGILIAFSFMFLTKSKTLKEISKKRPVDNIFNKYVIFSIVLQTVIHILSFVVILNTGICKDVVYYENEGFGLKSALMNEEYVNYKIKVHHIEKGFKINENSKEDESYNDYKED